MCKIEDVLLTGAEAARILGVRPRQLEYWRSIGKGPKFRRLGTKTIRISRADLEEFIEAARTNPAASAVLDDIGNR